MTMKNAQPVFFRNTLINWHRHDNNRQMPWKGEKDPYKIWLSEIILQQTRVEQGLPYYLRFITNYPTVASLAAAEDADVFKLWEGLGYYSRCRNLLAAARQIMDRWSGAFPKEYTNILELKGVGPYTAAAIASFAFEQPCAVVDGNVTRVLARFFNIETPFDSVAGKKEFANLAQQLLDVLAPANYNQAIMDFGATVCKPAQPLCTACPLQSGCEAYKNNRVAVLPIRSKKITRKTRWFYYWLLRQNGKILVRERHTKDIWQNLNEYFLIEDAQAFEWNVEEITKKAKNLLGAIVKVENLSGIFIQQLTHQTIHARFVEMNVEEITHAPEGYSWVQQEDITKLPFPKIINSFLAAETSHETFLF
jgi:A/G-specific adenine glycosylase